MLTLSAAPVRADDGPAAPKKQAARVESFRIIATDRGFEAPDDVPPGMRHIVFENRGVEIHERRLVKLRDADERRRARRHELHHARGRRHGDGFRYLEIDAPAAHAIDAAVTCVRGLEETPFCACRANAGPARQVMSTAAAAHTSA